MTTCDGNDRPGLWSPHDSAAVLVATPGGAATGQAVEGAAQNVPPDAFGSDVDVGQREGDTGAGRCRIPAVGEPLTEENRRRIEQARERAKEMERQRMEELASVTAAFRPAALITGSFLVCTLMALSALLGLFVLAQVTSTLAALASFPAWAQVLGWAGLLVLVGAL